MKKLIKIGKVLFILFVPLSLQAFALSRNHKRTLKKVHIVYQGNQNVYITDREIKNLLFQNKDFHQVLKDELDVFVLEDRLDTHQMIDNSDIFLTLDGVLEVAVNQRTPIARINDKGAFYYMDRKGKRMPLSKVYSARVPIVSGRISQENWKDIYRLVEEIRADNFLTKNITEIMVLSKDHYCLRLRIPDFQVVLGKAENLEVKFANLKAFYKKAHKDKLMDTYRQVDLQYDNQVVCSIK